MVEITQITHSNLLSHLESLKLSLSSVHRNCMCSNNSLIIQNAIINVETMTGFLESIHENSSISLCAVDQESMVGVEREEILSSSDNVRTCFQDTETSPLLNTSIKTTNNNTDSGNEKNRIHRMLEKSLVEHDNLKFSIDHVEGKLSELLRSIAVKENGKHDLRNDVVENRKQEKVSSPDNDSETVQLKLCTVEKNIENLLQQVEQKKSMIKTRQDTLQDKLSNLRRSLEAPI